MPSPAGVFCTRPRTNRGVLILSFLGLLAAASAADKSVSVQGVVQLDKKEPVAGVIVTAAHIAAAKGATQQKPVYAISAKDGSFSFSGLPDGTYQFCVQMTGGDILDPCEWSTTPPVTNVTAGKKAENLAITVQRGVFVHVRLDDDGDLIRKAQAAGQPATVRIGVSVPKGGFHGASMVVDGGKQRTYRVLVPYDTPLNLEMHANKVQLDDEKGQRFAPLSSASSFQVGRSEKHHEFRFKVKEAGK